MDEKQIKNLYNAYIDSKMTLKEEIQYERDIEKGLIKLPENKQLKTKLKPFDKDIHKAKDIGLGGPSTEYLITELLKISLCYMDIDTKYGLICQLNMIQ